MAREFIRANSDYLQVIGAPLTAVPLTLACWFRSTDSANTQGLMTVCASASAHSFRLLAGGAVAGDPIRLNTTGSGSASADSTTGYSANTWHHACGVSSATNSRTAYIDGGSAGSNTTTVTPAGIDSVDVGRIGGSIPTSYMGGRIAEAAIWNAALSAIEVAALARGLAPPYVRPANLVGYWPIWGLHSPEIDLCPVPQNMTVTGATFASHAPVRPFTRAPSGIFAAVEAPAEGQPTMRRWGGVPHMTSGGVKIGRSWYRDVRLRSGIFQDDEGVI